MKKWIKHLLVAGVITSFGLSVPNVITKHKTEHSSNTVEIAVDYRQVYLSAKSGDNGFEKEIHQTLKENGITSIGLTENNLYELETRDLVHVMKGYDLQENLWSQNHNIEIENDNTYILVPKGEKQEEVINTIEKSNIGKLKNYVIKDTQILEINKRMSDVYRMPLLYLESDYKNLSKSYHVIPRVSNEWKDRYPIIEEQLKKWDTQSKLSPVVFLGSEAEGYSEDEEGKSEVNVHKFWEHTGIGIIESFSADAKQNGVTEYAFGSDFNIVRVHSLSKERLETMEPIEMKRMIAKAAKERNIRIFYVNPFFKKGKETEKEYVERLGDAVKNVTVTLKESGFKLGQAKAFVEKENLLLSKIGVISSLLGAVYLFCLALHTAIRNKENPALTKLFLLALGSGTAAMVLGYLAGSGKILIQLTSLCLSVLLPVWGSLYIYSTLNNKEYNRINVFKHILLPVISLYIVGLSYLISMNHGIEHVTYIETFRGVSLTLTLPPVIVALFLLATMRKSISLKTVLFHMIRIVDVIVITAIGAFLMYYESRSGNEGTLLPFENLLRGWFEDTLPWRPRTKEIFLAFPLLMIMIGFWKKTKWSKVLLPLVTVGLASVFNTFTHFHTPIVASVGRSFLSVTIGLFIGLIIVSIVKSVLEVFGKSKN